jgi:hypothetical protein
MKLEDYVSFVEAEVFPGCLKTLKEIKSADDLTQWRKGLGKQIYSKQIEDEEKQV